MNARRFLAGLFCSRTRLIRLSSDSWEPPRLPVRGGRPPLWDDAIYVTLSGRRSKADGLVMLEIRCWGKKGFLGHNTAMVGAEGQQGDDARPLDGPRQCPLVPGAVTSLAARVYLKPVGEVSPQATHVLIVNVMYLVHAKGAYLSPGNITAPGPAASPKWGS